MPRKSRVPMVAKPVRTVREALHPMTARRVEDTPASGETTDQLRAMLENLSARLDKALAKPVTVPPAPVLAARKPSVRHRATYRQIAARDTLVDTITRIWQEGGIVESVETLKAYRRIIFKGGASVAYRGRHLLFLRANPCTDSRVRVLLEGDSKYYMSAVSLMDVDLFRDRADAENFAREVLLNFRAKYAQVLTAAEQSEHMASE
jgi:hypothetical protein